MKLHTVLKQPLITEKTMADAVNQNAYTFIVDPKATKHQIKEAVKEQFQVDVIDITTAKNAGYTKKTGKRRLASTVPAIKKAVVKLKPGQSIKAFEVKG